MVLLNFGALGTLSACDAHSARRRATAALSPPDRRPSNRRNKDAITLDRLRESAVNVFMGPRERFSSGEARCTDLSPAPTPAFPEAPRPRALRCALLASAPPPHPPRGPEALE